MTDQNMTTEYDGHVADRLSTYLEGDLPDGERREVESHLATCAACRADLASLRLTIRALRSLPSTPAPRHFGVPPASTVRPVATLRWVRVPVGALAAALLVIVGFRLLLLSPANYSPSVPTTAPAAPAAPPLAAAAPTFTAAPSAAAPAAAPPSVTPAPVLAVPAAAPLQTDRAASSPANVAASRASVPSPATPATRLLAAQAAPTSTTYPFPGSAPPTVPTGYPAPGGATSLPPYPSPASGAAPGAAPPAAYPAPAANAPPIASATSTGYPAPEVGGQSSALSPVNNATPVSLEAATRSTTWFTPALGILGGLVIATALLFIVLGRRQSG
jgi:hypothetical protein